MIKYGIDMDAIVTQFAQASARNGEATRKMVEEATLKALQARELTLTNIKQVLGAVAKAAAQGAAGNPAGAQAVEQLVAKGIAGMDAALQQAVTANQRALEQVVAQGSSLTEAPLKKALAEIDKMEDALFAALSKAASASAGPMQGVWDKVLEATRGQGTATGAQASAAVETLLAEAQKNLRSGRELGLRMSKAMVDHFTTMASGVLIGLSQALQGGSAGTADDAAKSPGRRSAKR